MIEFMMEPNVIAGFPALVLGILVMIAFRKYAFTWSGSAVGHLGAALFWLAMRSVGRSVWWDGFYGFGLGNSSNWFWNVIGIYACMHALYGVLMLLDAKERAQYNVLTIAFYPRTFRVRFFRERE